MLVFYFRGSYVLCIISINDNDKCFLTRKCVYATANLSKMWKGYDVSVLSR
jgi:hypothetical protein